MNFGGAGDERVSTRAINTTHEAGLSPWFLGPGVSRGRPIFEARSGVVSEVAGPMEYSS